MDAGDTRLIEYAIADLRRELFAALDAGFAMLRAELAPVADAAAVALETIIEDGDTRASDSDDAADDGAVAGVLESDDGIAEAGGDIEITADGEILQETAEVEELTPQEALDAIAPSRTHPLLRRVGGGFFGMRG